MPEYSAHEALLWQLIAKSRKRRLALHTALRTVYQRRQLLATPSGMLDRAFVSKQQWSRGLTAACNAMLVGLPTYGPLTARNSLKRLSGYLDKKTQGVTGHTDSLPV